MLCVPGWVSSSFYSVVCVHRGCYLPAPPTYLGWSWILVLLSLTSFWFLSLLSL